MTTTSRKFAPIAFFAVAFTLPLAVACGKNSSSSSDKAPAAAADQKVSLKTPDQSAKTDPLAPNAETAGQTSGTNTSATNASASVAGAPVPPAGSQAQNPGQIPAPYPGQNAGQYPGQYPGQLPGQSPLPVPPAQGSGSNSNPFLTIAPGVNPGQSLVQGTVTYQVVGMRFPKKIVAKPLEFVDFKDNSLANAQPVLSSSLTLRGIFIPAGTHVKGTLQLLSGGTSTFQAEWLQLDNGTSIALNGGGYIATEDSKMNSANAATIAAGALIGGGVAALVDHFLGSKNVSPWVVVGGAVAGGLIGWQVFPDETNVVVIQQDQLAKIGLN